MKSGSSQPSIVSPRKLRTWVIAGLVGVNLFVATLSALSLQQSREQHEERARIMARNIVATIDRSVSGSIEKIDLTLRAVIDDLERQLAERRHLDARWVDNLLKRYQARVPEIEAIRIANADGQVIFGKGVAPAAPISWADRDYFQFLRDHPDGGLAFAKPRMGKVAKTPIIGLGRRYNFPDGRFAGVVSAPVAVDYFTTLLSRHIVGQQGTAVLRDADLGLIARYPSITDPQASTIGSAIVSREFRELVRAGAKSATYHTDQAADQLARIASFQRIERAPMIVIAGLASSDYLADWHDEVRKALLWMAAFLLFSLVAAYLLLRLINRVYAENQRTQLFLRHSSDGIHILDDGGNIVEVSDQFCIMLGYTREELLGMNIRQWDAQWPAEELLGSVLPRKLHEKTASKLETIHRSKDQALHEVELTLASFGMDGRRYLFASARDIGERKRQQQALLDSEARLRQSEERYRLLLNHLPVGIIHFDTDLIITYANARFEQIMQLQPGQASQLDCKTLKDQVVIPPMRLALDGKAGQYEGPYLTTISKTPLALSMQAAPVFNSRGDILGGIAIIEDITIRKQADARLRLSASVFAHAHEGIIICDANKIILDVNPTFCEITGYRRDEVIGRSPHLLSSGLHDENFFSALWQKIADDGFWEGEIHNKTRSGKPYTERLTISAVIDDNGALTHYIGSFSDITALKEQQAQIEHLAHYDPLTHLPNRTLLADRMTHSLAIAKRACSQVAVCYLDLDGFKDINDNYGHDVGDKLLIEVANRLRDTLRAGDTVARLGGDEFVLLFVDIHGSEECLRTVSRLLKALAAPVLIGTIECAISASIGISLYPDDDESPDTLLRHADQAMYLAKQAGKNRFQFYDATHDHQLRSHREIIEQIRLGLGRGEFSLLYQPIVNMRKGSVIGVEGLLRWQHPQRGLLLPAEFLPAIAGNDLESEIGQWVLSAGLCQLTDWHRQGLSIQLNLNIATGHLLAADFVARLSALLASHPELPARHLELEILETAASGKLEQTCQVLEACQALGVSIAIDDFGTGYSSLAHFRRLPANTLKIDQTFVHSVLGNNDDLVIVDSVIKLTGAFNRKLIAEGIENVETGMLLLHLGCQVGQGYGIAPPLPAAAVPGWIADFRPDPNWASPAIHFTREDIPLLLAELEHRRWIKQLEEWLQGDRASTAAAPPLADDQCRFGLWYHGPGQQHYGRFPAFQAMAATHRQVHRMAQTLVDSQLAGKSEEARQGLVQLHLLRDQLIEQIAVLQALLAVEKSRKTVQ